MGGLHATWFRDSGRDRRPTGQVLLGVGEQRVELAGDEARRLAEALVEAASR